MRKKHYKKLAALLMVISMLLTVGQPMMVYAGGEPVLWTGSGTEADPYLINTVEDLAKLSDPGNVSYLSTYFRQTAEIDLGSYGNWAAIGDFTNRFTGTYDGGGYTISNLIINDNAARMMGLFGYVGVGGTVKNVKLEGATITSIKAGFGDGFIGSLVVLNFGTVSNSSSSSVNINFVAYSGPVGGLVAGNVGTIEASYSSGMVSSIGTNQNMTVGGLVGSSAGTIVDSYSTSSVNGSQNVGGLIGSNTGSISDSYSIGSVTGSGNVGGLAGSKGPYEPYGTFIDSYYDSETSGQSDTGKGTPKSTAEMKQLATFQSWDFENVWKIAEGSSYPTLQWQSPLTPEEEASQEAYFINQDIISAGEALTWDVIKRDNTGINSVLWDVYLPTTGENGTTISWSTSSTNWLDTSTGAVTRPGLEDGDQWIEITATISKAGGTSLQKGFNLWIPVSDPAAEAAIGLDYDSITWDSIKNQNEAMDTITRNLIAPLPGYGGNETTIIWSVVDENGDALDWIDTYYGSVKRPNSSEGDQVVNLIARVQKEYGTPRTKQFSLVIKAVDWTWQGDGSQENPYLVESAEQLNDLRFKMLENRGAVYFSQAVDIDLSTYGNWTPINYFTGTYKGNGHTISNLNINYDDAYDIGLFAVLEDQGRIENIRLENVDVSTTVDSVVGSLVGTNRGTISQSSSNGSISGETGTYLGGLAGSNYGTIENSYTSVLLNGNNAYEGGGLVGYNDGTIENSYSTSQINGPVSDYIGGLVAENYGTVSNSYYDSEISGQSDTDKGTPKTTAQMKQQATFAGWDFENTWKIIVSNSYPKLKYESWSNEETNVLITMDKNTLTWESIKGSNNAANSVTTNLDLQSSGANGTTITWSISPTGWINTGTGAVTRPSYSQGDKTVTLTAAISMIGGTSQTKDFILTIKARESTGGGGLSGTSAPIPTSTNNSSVTGSSLVNTIPVSVNSVTGSGVVKLEQSMAEALFGSDETVNINVPSLSGVNIYSLEMPASVLSKEQIGGVLTLTTDTASITITDNMLSGEAETNGKKAGITIGQGDKASLPIDIKAALGDKPLVQITLTLDGKQVPWNNPNAPVTVSIPYIPMAAELQDPEHITIWYIDGAGNTVSVSSGRYDSEKGIVTFTTTHFSQYAVAYVTKTFDDLSNAAWAKKSIEVLASKGVITGTGKDIYSPRVNITRAEYLLFLVNTLGLTAEFDSNFDDIEESKYYYEAVGIAKKLGITAGSGNNRFYPEENISRQDMMVLTARALEKFKKLEVAGASAALNKFKDKGDIAGYATDSMASLVREGLIAGWADMINPKSNTTRAEAAVFLYRIYNKY